MLYLEGVGIYKKNIMAKRCLDSLWTDLCLIVTQFKRGGAIKETVISAEIEIGPPLKF